MLERIPRIGAACALSAALVGGALLLPTAAQAATPTAATAAAPAAVAPGFTDFSYVRTAKGASVTIAFSASTAKAVDVLTPGGTVALAKRYHVRATAGATQLFDRHETATEVATTLEVLSLRADWKTEAGLAHDLRAVAHLRGAHAQRVIAAIERQQIAQTAVVTALTTEQGAVAAWVAANPSATAFTGLTGGTKHTAAGIRVVVSGTPTAYTIVARHVHGVAVAATFDSTTKATTYSKHWLADDGAVVPAS